MYYEQQSQDMGGAGREVQQSATLFTSVTRFVEVPLFSNGMVAPILIPALRLLPR